MHESSGMESPDQEVVGVFADRDGFEKAVRALLAAGFERSDLSVLASHESIDAAEATSKSWKDAITALVGEMKYEIPLVASGAIFLAGGATAALIAGLIGATVGGIALKEVLEEVTAAPHTEDFARAIETGSAVLWVRISHREKETMATTILQESGASKVHTYGSTSP